jgi:chloride channel protein, CIC family
MATPAPAPDPTAVLRSRNYVALLVLAAILGIPISAAAFGFLALVNYLQQELFTHLPHGLGFAGVPAWWPLPMLVIGAVLAAGAIRYLPGRGAPSPAGGFAMHPPPTPVQLPGVICAALATLAFGAVLGPEMPLIALGGGLGVIAMRLGRRRNVPDRAVSMVAASGSFAAISALLGSPILGAFLLMEAAGLAGATLEVVLVPGLLAAGIGSLVFTGLGSLTGLGTYSLTIPGLPAVGHPYASEFGWAVAAGLAAALIGPGIRWLGRLVYGYAQQRLLPVLVLAGLVVAALAIGYAQATGRPTSDVLFSGENAIGPLVQHGAGYTIGAVLLLLACKGLAYGVSLGSFRGGPVFPGLFVGAAGGVAMSHLPGLPLIAGVAIGMGAMSVVMLTLPMTSVLLATLLLGSDGLAVMPAVIVAVVVAYVASAWTAPRPGTGGEPAPAPAGRLTGSRSD